MKQIGRYEVLKELGHGEMGIVYLAKDPVLDRLVAVKTVRIQEVMGEKESPEYIKRFYREAQAAGKLAHPGIVTIFDAGLDPETQAHFIAMEYIVGRTLKDLLDGESRPALRESLVITARVAEALDYAHRHQVVHRDIKPANILLTDKGEVKITDFGIAKVPTSHLTMEGIYLGTPAYTSPEQVLGTDLDGRSDLFSLGIVLYELLSGRKPFPGDSLAQLFHQIVYDAPVPLSEVVPDCPEPLCVIVHKAMAKDPAERFSDGADMARVLRDFLEVPASEREPLRLEALPRGKEEVSPALKRTDPRGGTPSKQAGPPAPGGLRRRVSIRTFAEVIGVSLATAVLILGGLVWKARAENPAGTLTDLQDPVLSWKDELSRCRTDLASGKVEEALLCFQTVRLQRPQSPAVGGMIAVGMARLSEKLAAEASPGARAAAYLRFGRDALKRNDALSAAEYFQIALAENPQSAEAAEGRRLLDDAIRAQAPPEPVEVKGGKLVEVDLAFESPVPAGYLMAQVDGIQVLRKTFQFAKAPAAPAESAGVVKERLTLTAGKHRLQVWVTLKDKASYTAYGRLDVSIQPGMTYGLDIVLDAKHRKLDLSHRR